MSEPGRGRDLRNGASRRRSLSSFLRLRFVSAARSVTGLTLLLASLNLVLAQPLDERAPVNQARSPLGGEAPAEAAGGPATPLRPRFDDRMLLHSEGHALALRRPVTHGGERASALIARVHPAAVTNTDDTLTRLPDKPHKPPPLHRFIDHWLLMTKPAAAGAQTASSETNGNGGNGDNGLDADDPPEAKNELAPGLTYGGKVQASYELERNFDLRDGEKDDVAVVEPSLEVAFSYKPNEHIEAFVNFKLQREIGLREEEGEEDRFTELEVDEAYVRIDDVVDDLGVQLGRQKIKDDREWWYDQELDAVRVFYELFDIDFDLSVSRERVVDRDLLSAQRNARVNNYLASAEYEVFDDDDKHPLFQELDVAAFAVLRDDRENDDEEPWFLGVRSSGELLDGFEYWTDFAIARGKDGSDSIRGYAFDVGGTFEFDAPLSPYATLGYAFGSGDGNGDDNVDRDFRQTGLEGNSAKLGGVTRIKYYGELFDPELSNMSIFTAGIGFRPLKRTSIDLLYHRYRLDELSDELKDVGVTEDLSGRDKALGEEFDLVIAYRAIEGFKIELGLGYFMPGRAFEPARDDAFSVNFEIEYEF